jgi:hypothetical protein
MGAIVIAATSVLSAQAPIINASIEHRAVSSSLSREIETIAQQGRTVWVGYRLPIAQSRGERITISETCCGRCRLAPPTELIVLARVDRSGVTEIRPESVDCDIDAAGMTLVWLDGVRPDDSVTWLSAFVRDASRASTRLADRALTAVALHAAPSVVPVLVTTARTGVTPNLKGRALFWLAQRAAAEALPAINLALEQDPDTQVKKQAVFALSQMKDEGVPRLIELARSHPNTEVRRQAIFWLGQSKDQRAVDFFASILR